MKRSIFRAVDPSLSPAERRLARHKRYGLIDLALFALFWLCAGLGILPPLLAAVMTALFALIWTTDLIGYRLFLRQEQREAASDEALSDGQLWKPGQRATLTYVGLLTLFTVGVVISVVWIGVHFGVAPRGLAIALTGFITLVLIAASVMAWLAYRRILRERAAGDGD